MQERAQKQERQERNSLPLGPRRVGHSTTPPRRWEPTTALTPATLLLPPQPVLLPLLSPSPPRSSSLSPRPPPCTCNGTSISSRMSLPAARVPTGMGSAAIRGSPRPQQPCPCLQTGTDVVARQRPPWPPLLPPPPSLQTPCSRPLLSWGCGGQSGRALWLAGQRSSGQEQQRRAEAMAAPLLLSRSCRSRTSNKGIIIFSPCLCPRTAPRGRPPPRQLRQQ